MIAGILLLAAVTIWKAADIARSTAVDGARETGRERLALYDSTLQAALERYRYLPFVVTRNNGVNELVSRGGEAGDVNLYLEQINAQAGADALYVLDANGETLAASNWRSDVSFVGHNYSFRPYFRDAMEGKAGSFFAIGATTGEPGYFLSWPIVGTEALGQADKILGVAVVKVDLNPLQQDWRDGGETVFVSDSNGVVFLSSRADWKYRTLGALTPETVERIRRGRQYRGIKLQPLELMPVTASSAAAERPGDGGSQGQLRRFGGTDYLLQSRNIENLGGRLHYLSPLANVTARVSSVIAIMAISWILLFFAILFLRERRLKAASARRAREAMAIEAVNRKLQAEIEERRRAEGELRETQNELVQAGKLAALGQMSAAIAHELNQPLAAIQTFLAGSRIFLKRGDSGQVEENLTTLSRLADRMGAITGQLKTFARKSEGKLAPVVLQDAVADALALLDPQIRLDAVEIVTDLPSTPVTVRADEVRVGQVLVNFVRNAIDAMEESDKRLVTIALYVTEQTAVLSIDDVGHGISDENLAKLFDPFFTTKEVGEGIGLGLSISYGIITDLGGSLQAENNPAGGARFTIRLPVLEQAETALSGFAPAGTGT
ncbi:ATP-binding protein [Pelagibius sp. Alg239-R121]|uniref:sensor histidine kinase n=1 Tax=Pelagibius sp. Alg239-R121 TaxID=2993448 RepID=UPI0024A66A02|nr:ATP-binding protein [Pelagibius sp. Alg239-R121]